MSGIGGFGDDDANPFANPFADLPPSSGTPTTATPIDDTTTSSTTATMSTNTLMQQDNNLNMNMGTVLDSNSHQEESQPQPLPLQQQYTTESTVQDVFDSTMSISETRGSSTTESSNSYLAAAESFSALTVNDNTTTSSSNTTTTTITKSNLPTNELPKPPPANTLQKESSISLDGGIKDRTPDILPTMVSLSPVLVNDPLSQLVAEKKSEEKKQESSSTASTSTPVSTSLLVSTTPATSIPTRVKSEPQLNKSTSDASLPKPKYTFEVSVTEPQKVGDTIGAHITYRVKTKTNHPSYRNSESTVNRRYKDFLWLHTVMTASHPGVIVPPIPEKHAIGRFQDEFVENRRMALERCLQKMTSHPILQDDADLRLFLGSEQFHVDIKDKDVPKPIVPAATSSSGSGMGILGRLTSVVTGGGSFSNTPSGIPKEIDFWFDTKRNQVDLLESQLKSLYKAIESLVKHRKDLGVSVMDFGDSLMHLSRLEMNRPVSNKLSVLGGIHQKLKALHERQARQDIHHLAATIDEYIRIIATMKLVMATRGRAYTNWQTCESSLSKKRETLERTRITSKLRTDKITMLEKEVEEASVMSTEAKKVFDDVSATLKAELERFDKEKVVDFVAAVRAFLEGLAVTQREMIALWESYYEQTKEKENSEKGKENVVVKTEPTQ